jgi:predicted RNA polymerase sigma factor
VKSNPLVRLNRAVVTARIDGPRAGIDEIHRIEGWEALASKQFLYNAVLGQLYLEANDTENARRYIQAADALTASEAEKRLLRKKLSRLPRA